MKRMRFHFYGILLRLYKIQHRILRLLSKTIDALSPGIGLRRRCRAVDRFFENYFDSPPRPPSFKKCYRTGENLMVPIRCGTVKFQLHLSTREEIGSSPVTHGLVLDGIWEPLASRLVCDLLGPGSVVIDVGANVGYYSILAGKLVGADGRVLAFEPDPYSYALLVKNVHLNGLEQIVIPINKAVGDSNTRLKLFLSKNDSGDHRCFDPGDGRTTSIEVESIRLDDYVQANFPNLMRSGKIGFIKMDIQGYEVRAYVGARGLIAAHHPTLITEYEPCTLSSAGSSSEAYLGLLNDYGYDRFAFIFWDPKQKEPVPIPYHELLKRTCAGSSHHHGYLYCTQSDKS